MILLTATNILFLSATTSISRLKAVGLRVSCRRLARLASHHWTAYTCLECSNSFVRLNLPNHPVPCPSCAAAQINLCKCFATCACERAAMPLVQSERVTAVGMARESVEKVGFLTLDFTLDVRFSHTTHSRVW